MGSDDNYEYELPDKDYDGKNSFLNGASSSTGSMIDPNGKNVYTWIIGVLLLLCISAGGLLIGIYENILSEKDEKIKLLEERDCIKELKKSLLVQELLHEELKKVSELKVETNDKVNNLLENHE